MTKFRRSIATIALFLLTVAFVAAQSASNVATPEAVPPLMKFSGTVKDDAGHVTTGVVGVTFALYKDQVGGAPLWLETQNVQADSKGNYTALLGSTKPEGLPAGLFTSNEARWLGVQPEGQAEQPRVLFVSVPYALKAADAETIGGLPPSAFVRTAQQDSGSNSTGASTSSRSSPAATVGGAGTTNFLPIWKSGTSLGNSTVFESAGKVGINTTTPAFALDVNGSSVVRGNQSVTGSLGIGTTPPNGPFRLQVETNNQLGAIVQGPFSGVGAGIDLQTTGSGGKQWEILATGKTSSQSPGKLNIRNVNDGQDVFTIDTLDTVNVLNLNSTGNIVSQGNLFVKGVVSALSNFGMISLGPVGIGPEFKNNLAKANLDVQGNNLDAYVGDPGCGANPFAGIAFGTGGFKNCTGYSMVGNGADTFIGAPSGSVFFRTNSNTTTPMLITPGGQVGIGTTTPTASLHVVGNVQVNDDFAVSSNPHMTFSGYFSTVDSLHTGGFFVPDRSILVTRLSISINAPGACAFGPTLGLIDAVTLGTLLSVAIPPDTDHVDSGPDFLPVTAGEGVKLVTTDPGNCTVSPADVFVNVQYVMQ
jgi:hypothetical protein